MLVVFVAIGLPLYYLIVPRLQRARDSEMLSLILFFGLSQMIEAVATIVLRHHRTFPARARAGDRADHHARRAAAEAWVFSAVVSAVAVAGVYLYLYRTRLGTLTRAVMVCRDEALATGIDVHRVSAIAFGISLALAGIAGVFAPFMLGSITPSISASD